MKFGRRHFLAAVLALFFASAPRATLGQGKPASDGRVAVSGHLSRDAVRKGTDIRFWITIENRSPASLQNVHLDRLEITGFEKSRWCWGPVFDMNGCGVAVRSGPACFATDHSARDSEPGREFELCDE